MTDYNIRKAFERIENELIASMIRNMENHRAQEDEEGFQWEQWQALQLKELEAYKRRNQKVFGKKFREINEHLELAILKAREDGNMEQELKLLEMVKTGKIKRPRATKKAAKTNAEFFKLNDRKMDALIRATVSDMEKAETAILRMANDKYRKVIFDAQVYANSGAGTYEKAVDMATRDFLSAGLNCVEYKNGARHTLKDYADMALRTASKRAYLTGEGEKRKEWGISTVIVTKRGNPCPLCLPFVGKVMIDDVWSGGPASGISPETGIKYPLMSDAVSAGLYHPRCQDDHSTFFEGLDENPDDKFTKAEIKEIEAVNKAEAKKQYAKRQAEKYGRLGKYSLDEKNRMQYASRADEWTEKIKMLEDEDTSDVLELFNKRGKINENSATRADGFKEKFGIRLEDCEELDEDVLSILTEEVEKAYGLFGNLKESGVLKSIRHFSDAIIEKIEKDIGEKISWLAGYQPDMKMLALRKLDSKDAVILMKIKAMKNHEKGFWSTDSERHLIRHELGHAVQFLYFENNSNDILKEISKLRQSILSSLGLEKWEKKVPDAVRLKAKDAISYYALHDDGEFIAECIAEYMNGNPREIAKTVVELLLESR